jgi:hypothetical protein
MARRRGCLSPGVLAAKATRAGQPNGLALLFEGDDLCAARHLAKLYRSDSQIGRKSGQEAIDGRSTLVWNAASLR